MNEAVTSPRQYDIGSERKPSSPLPIFGILSLACPFVGYVFARFPPPFVDRSVYADYGSDRGFFALLLLAWGVMLAASVAGLGCTAIAAIRHERWIMLPMLGFFINLPILGITLLPIILQFLKAQ